MKKVIITPEVFELFPEFNRGILVVRDLENHKSYKRVRKLLKAEIEHRKELDVDAEPRLDAWVEAHRRFGSDPVQFPPSVKSLVSRIKPNPNLPFINTVVALFNTVSLKYLLPCGGDAVDEVEGNLVLGRARGDERFRPLGGGDESSPAPGEVIYFDDANGNVLCRRWNWRNGETTKIEVDSKRLVINLDGLPPVSKDTLREARDELAALLVEHCQAVVETSWLDAQERQLSL